MKHTARQKWHHLYNTRWQRTRSAYLSRNPLCQYCLQVGRVTQATIVDHVIPHKGDEKLFWDAENYRGLCKLCHDSTKAEEENKGYAQGCGQDGMPVDPKHPWYKE